MQRPLSVLLAGQVVGILAGDRGWIDPLHAAVLAGVCLALAVLCRHALLRGLLLAAAACGSSALHLGAELERTRATALTAPAEMIVEARVDAVLRGRERVRLHLDEVVRIDPGRVAPGGVFLYADARRSPILARALPGQRLRLRVRLRPLGGSRNPGRADRTAADLRRGIGALGRAVHPRLVIPLEGEPNWLGPIQRLRRDVGERLLDLGPGGGLLAALALGERAGLTRELRDAFSALGISHLLAVSGLHLALAAGGAYAVSRRLLGRFTALSRRVDARKAALGVALLAAALQALLAGLGVPVRRAWVLLLGAAADVARGRPARRGSGLVAAALAILAFEAGALFDAGAQLSFAAAAALVIDAEKGRSGFLRGSATAILATAPLAALRFGASASAALAVNAVAVPLTGFVLLPVALISAAGLALAPVHPAVVWFAEVATDGAAVVQDFVLRASVHAGSTPAPPAFASIAGAAVISATGLVSGRTRARVVAAGLAGIVLAFGPRPEFEPAPPRAIFLDVGQGDAVLVQGRRGAILVDAGSAWPGGDRGRDAVVPALRALGIERLDLLAVSHGDLDHRGGVLTVLDALPVGRIWLPRGAEADARFDALREAAAHHHIAVEERGGGDSPQRFGDVVVVPLWPPPDEAWRGNDASLVLRVRVSGRRVLLPGDLGARAERALIASGADLRADVMLLPHHGSRTSGSDALLAATGAAAAVASAPCHGRFGMPHAHVVARARRRGLALWWTGRDGAVWAALGERLWIRGTGAPRCLLGQRGG